MALLPLWQNRQEDSLFHSLPAPPSLRWESSLLWHCFSSEATFDLHLGDIYLQWTSKEAERQSRLVRGWVSGGIAEIRVSQLHKRQGQDPKGFSVGWMLLAWAAGALPGIRLSAFFFSLQATLISEGESNTPRLPCAVYGSESLAQERVHTLIHAACRLCVLEQVRLLCVIAWWNIPVRSVNTNYTAK